MWVIKGFQAQNEASRSKEEEEEEGMRGVMVVERKDYLLYLACCVVLVPVMAMVTRTVRRKIR